MVHIFFGLSSFVITGTDDLLVLVLFFIQFQHKFKQVVIGTLLGLLCVMIPSYFFAKTLSYFEISSYIRTDWVLGAVLVYVAYGLIKDGFSQNDGEELEDLSGKTSFQVIVTSGVTYFLNGLDDFVVYSGFYLKYQTLEENILFSFGIISGVFLFAFIAQYAGNMFLVLEQKFQNKIKIMLGYFVFFVAGCILFL